MISRFAAILFSASKHGAGTWPAPAQAGVNLQELRFLELLPNKMISFDQAIAILREVAVPLGTEDVPLERAYGRILAEPVIARIAAPSRDTSAMDGYAVRNADVGTIPVVLQVIGKSFPGKGFDGIVGENEAVRIFTGAPVPQGADRVIIQENVTEAAGKATICAAFGPGRYIRKAGSDFLCGEELLPVNIQLGPGALLAAAAADYGHVRVWRRPKLAIISTGDELVAPGTAARMADHIPDSISFGIAALVKQRGGELISQRRVTDALPDLQRAADEAVSDADLIIVTGGASVGERDYAKAMFEALGLEILFAKVSVKPGKPVWLGRAGGRLVLGLPGNPTSAMVTARLFLAPLLAGLSGTSFDAAINWQAVNLSASLPDTGDRETFFLARDVDGLAVPITSYDSSGQKMLPFADLILRRAANQPSMASGSAVVAIRF